MSGRIAPCSEDLRWEENEKEIEQCTSFKCSLQLQPRHLHTLTEINLIALSGASAQLNVFRVDTLTFQLHLIFLLGY